MSLPIWIGVALLGGVGAVTRFLLDGVLSAAIGRALPLGTFVVNLSGAFLLGLFTGLAFSGAALTLAGTATIGSYTTFSTWMLETQRLRDEGEFGWAGANVIASLTVGLGAAALGRWIGAHG
jgi:CrcB protein